MATSSLTALLDTDVLIDILRQHPAALTWLQTNATIPVVIHGVVAMEILAGSRNKQELQRNQAFLAQFTIIWPTPAEFQAAYAILAQYYLSTSIGVPDCLIVATALTYNWRLYTFNLKHYRHITGLDVQISYQR